MDVLNLVGYFASGLIALSMTQNSILRFRWINLAGALSFSIYGFVIGALPVGLLNGFIVVVDVYYLWVIYTKKELFETLEIQPGSKYLMRFVEFHDKDIQKVCPGFVYRPDMNTLSYFILRNMQVAGLFLARREGDVLTVGVDYVVPEYRDFKNGRFIYSYLVPVLKKAGIHQIRAAEATRYNEAYLKKMGFRMDAEGHYSMPV